MSRGSLRYLLAAAVSLVTFIVYLPALRNEFIWDDYLYVVDNPNIRSMGPVFFKWAFWSFFADNWHPLTWISHALDYAVWGPNPVGHHLTQITLHAANTFLVVLLCLRLLDAGRERAVSGGASQPADERRFLLAAGVAGIVFGLHPVHVQSAVWIADRKDPLCALFFLLSVLAYMGHVRSWNGGPAPGEKGVSRFFTTSYLLSLFSFLLALMSKPMAVSLPAVLLILDWHPFRRIRDVRSFRDALWEKLPYIALSLLSSVLSIMSQNAGGALAMMEWVPLRVRMLVAARALFAYLGIMAAPSGLSPFYSYPELQEVGLLAAPYLLAVLSFVAVTAVLLVFAEKQRVLLSAWGYYVVTLIPVIGIVQVGSQAMADRYTYLPSIGPIMLLGLGAAWLWERAGAGRAGMMRTRPAVTVLAAALCAALIYGTVAQIAIWKNGIALWSHVIGQEPDRAVLAYTNRGMAYEDAGRYDLALSDLDRAIALNPRFGGAYVNRGMLYQETGQLERALEDFTAAITADPGRPEAFYDRGLLYRRMGQPDRAIEDLTAALALNPSGADIYANRGLAFQDMGRYDRALLDLSAAIDLNPDFAATYVYRGMMYKEMGRLAQAIDDYTKAIALNPSGAEAYNDRGVVHKHLGRLDLAMADFNRAIALDPSFATALCNRGIVLGMMGRSDQAIEDYTAALRLDPGLIRAYLDRGGLYRERGDRDSAWKDYQRACEIGSKDGCRAARLLRR